MNHQKEAERLINLHSIRYTLHEDIKYHTLITVNEQYRFKLTTNK